MSRVTQKQAHQYFQTLVELQPETAVDILFVLFSREIDIEEWIKTTADDIIDSENQDYTLTCFIFNQLKKRKKQLKNQGYEKRNFKHRNSSN